MAITAPPYHIGIVVADIEQAKTQLSDILGLAWAKTQRGPFTMDMPDGPKTFESCFTYSLQGPPYLELIEQREGTIFAETGLHHIGVWADDPKSESKRLEGCACARESVGLRADGSWSSALFHKTQDNLRIEVVDIGASGPRLARYLKGGVYS